uniref:Uncharacterized protein n=1 Tax=Arundo donax TaxID=35708 RepID=A0A0A9B848_ARUDO
MHLDHNKHLLLGHHCGPPSPKQGRTAPHQPKVSHLA